MFLSMQTHIGSGAMGYGDGSDGNATISANTSWETTTSIDNTGFVVKQYNNLTINAGVTVTPSRPNKGLFLFCRGDLTLNGIITNSKLGSNAAMPQGFSRVNLRMLPYTQFSSYPEGRILDTDDYSSPSVGAVGGTSGGAGVAGVNGQCGGGGSGSYMPAGGSGVSGAGGTAQPFGGGGSSAGVGYCGTGCTNNSPDAVGCAGGTAYCTHCGWGTAAGAGNPTGGGISGGGYGLNGAVAQFGVGGLIFIFVRGTLTFGGQSQLLSKGANGGTAWSSSGGSGGGAINVFYHHGLVTNSGYSIDSSGGLSGGSYAGAGGAGSIRVVQLTRWL